MASRPDNGDFRDAVSDVEPLKRHKRADLKRPPARPVARQRLRDEAAALAESLHGPLLDDDVLDTGESLSYLREGMAHETLRKLRRGHWAIQDGIDLHGMTRAQASAFVADFLNRCLARGLRCVRIVHGKGLGSKNREPVLKGKLRAWLMPRDEVLAYCQAPAAEGGSGALLVLLKAR